MTVLVFVELSDNIRVFAAYGWFWAVKIHINKVICMRNIIRNLETYPHSSMIYGKR